MKTLTVIFLSQLIILSIAYAEDAKLYVQLGHWHKVTSVAFSPDGRFLLTASEDTTARLWDAESGLEIEQFNGHSDSVTSIAFSPDGRFVLTGSTDHTARLWNAKSSQQIQKFDHSSAVMSVAFSPDGLFVLTGNWDNTAHLWDAGTGQELRKFQHHVGPILAVAFSPDGRFLLTGSFDNSARLWDIGTGRELREFHGHTSAVSSATFSPDGHFVLTGSQDHSARLWDMATGQELWKLQDYHSVTAVAFSPDGRFVLTGGEQSAWLWDAASGRYMRRLDDSDGHATSVAFSPDGRLILTGGQAGVLRLRDAATGWVVRNLKSQHDLVESVAFSPDGRFMLTGSRDNTARLWDAATGQEVRRLRGHCSSVTAVAFSPDGRFALTGSSDRSARLWDAATGAELRIFRDQSADVTSVTFSPDGRFVLIGTEGYGAHDNKAQMWDAATGQEKLKFEGHSGSVTSVAFSADGRFVLTGSSDKTVWLWDATTGNEVRKFTGHSGPVTSVAFSPDGRFVLTGSRDNTARLWDEATGQEIRKFEGHSNWIYSVAFSPDGQFVLTGSLDKTARLWNAATGQQVHNFEAHSGWITSVTFSPDGRFVLTASDDGTARLWGSNAGRLIATLVSDHPTGWTVVAPNGRFDTNNLDGGALVHWVIDSEPMPLEVLLRDYFTSRLLPRLLRGKPLPDVRPITTLNRAQPTVRVLKVAMSTQDRVTVQVEATSKSSSTQKATGGDPLQSGVYDVRLFRDGQLVAKWPEDAPGGATKSSAELSEAEREQWRQQHHVEPDANGQVMITFSNIQLPQGKSVDHVTFTAYAFNSDRVKSETSAPLVFNFPPPKRPRPPRAYVVTMGVNASQASGPWDLSVAVPSAREAARLWRERLSKDYEVVDINLEAEVDADGAIARADATKANLHAILDLLAGRENNVSAVVRQVIDPQRKLQPATPDDAVVLHVASHGYADSQGRFFLIPFDTGTQRGIDEQVLTRCHSKPDGSTLCAAAESFLSHAISSDELATWWSGVDGGEMVMVLDSCHSGAAPGQGFRPGPLGDRGFGQLAYDKGLRIFAATQPDKVARGTIVQGSVTLLIEALQAAGTSTAGQRISVWLRTAERMLPQQARQLYPTLNEDDLQWPELMDFRREPTVVETGQKKSEDLLRYYDECGYLYSPAPTER